MALSEASRSGRGHLPALDGLRGIAILLVLLLHATEGLNRVHALSPTLLATTRVGFTGVDLFFVLSGFLITGILLDARGSDGYFKVFYARRILRIFPLYYAYLAIVFLVLPLLPVALHAAYQELRAHQAWYWLYLSNVFNATQAGWRVDGPLTPHFWSLAVEEQFYLIWPTVVLLLSATRLRNACIAIILAAPLLRLGLRLADVNPVAVYVLTITRADALAMGALLAVMLRGERERELLRRLALPALGLAGLGIGMLGIWRGGFNQFDSVIGTAGYSAWAAVYGALLATAVTAPAAAGWVPRALSAQSLRFFGKYSYAMYVFHMPITGLAERVFPYPLLREKFGVVGVGLLFVGAVVLATSLLSLLSWWGMERRFIALKDRFKYGSSSRTLVETQ